MALFLLPFSLSLVYVRQVADRMKTDPIDRFQTYENVVV